MLNTAIHYLYRDASNYKVHTEVVLKGEITAEQIKEVCTVFTMVVILFRPRWGFPKTDLKIGQKMMGRSLNCMTPTFP